jgi:hypothetical protein
MPSQTSFRNFRIATLAFAMVLGAQSIWLLLAEFSRPGINSMPTDSQSAALAAKQRNDATWAAWIGAVRGDLWADSAYTYSDLLWANSSNSSENAPSMALVRDRLDRAVGYAPNQPGAWLLLAGLASRYRWSKPDPAEALKMSYYTGPSELQLMPLRLLVTVQLDALNDSELQLLARRDIRLLFAHQGEPVVIQAYQSATPAGKHFIEQVIGEIDPTFVESLRGGAQ